MLVIAIGIGKQVMARNKKSAVCLATSTVKVPAARKHDHRDKQAPRDCILDQQPFQP